MSTFRNVIVAAALAVSATGALAAASNTPTFYQVDPALKTESLPELQARVRQACSVTQARLQNSTEFAISKKCDCYAGRTMRSLSAEEVQAYRDTGVFNDSARDKALKAIDSCKLQRPTI